MAEHADLTGTDAYHPTAYYQASDPGSIGAGKNWIDTTYSPPTLKRRNTGNTDWDVVLNPSPYVTASSLVHYSSLR